MCEIAVVVVAVPSDIAEMPVEATSDSPRGLRLEELRILGGDWPASKQISRTRNSSVCHTTIFSITHLSLRSSSSHAALIRFLLIGVGSAAKERQHLMKMRMLSVNVPLKMPCTSSYSSTNLFTMSTNSCNNHGSSANRYCVIIWIALFDMPRRRPEGGGGNLN